MASSKVYKEPGGDRLRVDAGGSVEFAGIKFTVNAAGNLVITGLPTSEPAAVGAVWNNAGVLTVSDGP